MALLCFSRMKGGFCFKRCRCEATWHENCLFIISCARIHVYCERGWFIKHGTLCTGTKLLISVQKCAKNVPRQHNFDKQFALAIDNFWHAKRTEEYWTRLLEPQTWDSLRLYILRDCKPPSLQQIFPISSYGLPEALWEIMGLYYLCKG